MSFVYGAPDKAREYEIALDRRHMAEMDDGITPSRTEEDMPLARDGWIRCILDGSCGTDLPVHFYDAQRFKVVVNQCPGCKKPYHGHETWPAEDLAESYATAEPIDG